MADSGPSTSSTDQNAVGATDTPTLATLISDDTGPSDPDTTEDTTSTPVPAIADTETQSSKPVSVLMLFFRMLRNSQIDARGNMLRGSPKLLTLRSLPPPVMRHLQTLRRLQPLRSPALQVPLQKARRLRQPRHLLFRQRYVIGTLV